MDHDTEAAHDSCTAYDTMSDRDAQSVIRPAPLPNMQIQASAPAPGNPANPLLASVPPPVDQPNPLRGNTSDDPSVPQLQMHQDPYVSQEHAADPNDKLYTISGTWDTNTRPQLSGVQADVAINRTWPDPARVHGDQLQLDLTGQPPRQRFTPPPPQQVPTTIPIRGWDLTPPGPLPVPPDARLSPSAPNVPDLHSDLLPLPNRNP